MSATAATILLLSTALVSAIAYAVWLDYLLGKTRKLWAADIADSLKMAAAVQVLLRVFASSGAAEKVAASPALTYLKSLGSHK